MEQATVAFIVKDEKGKPIPKAFCRILEMQMCGDTNQDGYHAFDFINIPRDYHVTVQHENYKMYDGVYSIGGNTDLTIQLESSVPDFNPTRDEIIHVRANSCNILDADGWPIFDPYIDWLIFNNSAKADDWVTRLRAAGSTHINIDLSGDYDENLGWINRYPIPGTDWTRQPEEFKYILDFCLERKLIPIVHLAADGQGFDPVGLTYGWQWGMTNLPNILPAFRDYFKKCLWNTGWDGCFPNWSPEQTTKFLQMMRSVLGMDAQIATEFGGPSGADIGYIHMGHGAADWWGPLNILDAFFIELQSVPCPDNAISEVATRLLGPNAANCPTVPYYLPDDKTRGICYFETCMYQYIRKQVDTAFCKKMAQQGQHFGFKDFGSGMP